MENYIGILCKYYPHTMEMMILIIMLELNSSGSLLYSKKK